jgi:general secretion pathway protein D
MKRTLLLTTLGATTFATLCAFAQDFNIPGAGAAAANGRIATTPVQAAGQGAPPARAQADTGSLPQFEQAMEFAPRNPNDRVAFALEDADLNELVRVIGQMTGKRFIFGGKVRNIKASVYSPQKVTVAEAYQAFLSILETNGLTVVPHGRFLKIIETAGIASQTTPTYGDTQAAPAEDRYVTRLHRLQNINVDDAANVLGKFKSKEGDITTYAPGNMLIITDTGVNIRRMLEIVDQIDVGGAGEQVWIEPVHYGAASDLATRINDIFDLKGGGGGGQGGGAPGGPGAPRPAGGAAGAGDLRIAKIVADDRTNSLIIVSTERAYLRILEFLKRIDVPQTGEGEIHVLPLQHADATELVKTLNEIVSGAAQAGTAGQPGAQPRQGGGSGPPSGIFEGGVKVSADKATNSIVITSSMRDYASIRTVIDRLDQPRRQVFIEAVIMDLNISRGNQFGVRFHGGSTVGDGEDQSLVFGGLSPLTTVLPPQPSDLQATALGIRGPAIPNSQNLLGTGITVPAFGALITALATTSDTDVLSTPHILATDNIPAEINVGENVPLQQAGGGIGLPGLGGLGGAPGAGGAAGAAAGLGALGGLGAFGFSPQRQDVGTKLRIVPHLNESNEVRLELTEEISEARAPSGALQVVPITKRTANTQLVVRDQQTVVIGGLMRNRVTHSQRKFPILGDIPVLGALFRENTSGLEKTNLVLILTPYIIRDQSDLRAIFERKMQERQEFLDRYFVFSDDQNYQPPKDYSRTNGLVEDIRQAFMRVEERRALDELTRPRDLKTHQPGMPLEMPSQGTSARGAAGGGAPEGNAPAVNPAIMQQPGLVRPPNLNIQPPPRSVDRQEP